MCAPSSPQLQLAAELMARRGHECASYRFQRAKGAVFMSGQVLGSLIVVKKIVNLVDSSAKSAHYIQYLECIASIFKCDVMHEKKMQVEPLGKTSIDVILYSKNEATGMKNCISFRRKYKMWTDRVIQVEDRRDLDFQSVEILTKANHGRRLLSSVCDGAEFLGCSNEFSQAGWVAHQIWSSWLGPSTKLQSSHLAGSTNLVELDDGSIRF
ncbi:hypothetical protein V9T40_006965 [Parthenolecanium corni]|uniref:Uncharacterized protein n=1 Tax=Parthenolecanium corni TaxID=536013 RepID=A0AAN9TUF2_9HEMI